MSDRFRSRPYRSGTRLWQDLRLYNFQAPVEEFFVISILGVTGLCAVIVIAFAL